MRPTAKDVYKKAIEQIATLERITYAASLALNAIDHDVASKVRELSHDLHMLVEKHSSILNKG